MFSVITPSFQSGAWLPLCVASVRDQQVELEHIVQDAGSTDTTHAFCAAADVRIHVEKDFGMYDAVNRGLNKSKGDLLAYLNCDEQYLPGALQAVQEWFAAHPDVEVLFAHSVIVDEKGGFIAYRKALPPLISQTWVGGHLSVLTCSTFFRRSVLNKGFLFDPGYRYIGDLEWVLRLLRSGVKMGILNRYAATFTETGENLSNNPKMTLEVDRTIASAPNWMRKSRRPIIALHRLRRLLHGCYFQPQFGYDIFTSANPEERTRFHVAKPSFRWRL